MNIYKITVQKIVVLALLATLLMPINFRVNGSDDILISGDFQYKIYENIDGTKEASICGYTGENSEIVVPETLDGYEVTSVDFLDGSKKVIHSLMLSKNIREVSCLLERVSSKWENRFIEIAKYEVASNNPYLSAINGVLFNKEQTKLLIYPRGKKDLEYTEPSTVEKSRGANHNPYVKKWTLSCNKKYTWTEDYMYCDCSNLEEITIPRNVRKIGNWSFAGCPKLKKINWHNKLERIGSNAFYGCISLTQVKIPDSVLSIAGSAFEKCNLASVKLSNRVKYIGLFAFAGNPRLKKVRIPDSVTKMDKNAFDMKNTKLMMPSYLKQKDWFYHYIAKATVTSAGKTKDYKAVYITKIKPVKKKVTIQKGKKQTLHTKVYIRNKDRKIKKNGILKTNILHFTSSNNKVARVTSSGKVKALRKGTTVITVTLRTAKESYKTKPVGGTAADKMTKKSYRVKVRVK